MRVISGSAGGRRLKEPSGNSIRPTSDKVKEAIFNIIQFDIKGRRVLDLFAGTGQLGIEALSRGAASAVFADSSFDSIKLVRENLQICGFSDLAAVYNTDALRYIEKTSGKPAHDEKFDIIFVDPPFGLELNDEVLEKLVRFDKLGENGIIISESSEAIATSAITEPYEFVKQYRYGKVIISKICRHSGP